MGYTEDDDIREFDLEDMLNQMRVGHKDLVERRHYILDTTAAFAEELKEVESQIDKLAAMFASLNVTISVPERPRSEGVLALTESVVTAFFATDVNRVIPEADILAAVKLQAPTMLDKSIRSALSKLVKDTNLVRLGKRGSYFYTAEKPTESYNDGPNEGPKENPTKFLRTMVGVSDFYDGPTEGQVKTMRTMVGLE